MRKRTFALFAVVMLALIMVPVSADIGNLRITYPANTTYARNTYIEYFNITHYTWNATDTLAIPAVACTLMLADGGTDVNSSIGTNFTSFNISHSYNGTTWQSNSTDANSTFSVRRNAEYQACIHCWDRNRTTNIQGSVMNCTRFTISQLSPDVTLPASYAANYEQYNCNDTIISDCEFTGVDDAADVGMAWGAILLAGVASVATLIGAALLIRYWKRKKLVST